MKEDEGLSKYGLDVTTYDILMNNIQKDNQLCQHNGVPWCGARENDFVFMSTFIQTCCVSRDVVVDLIANACMLAFLGYGYFWWNLQTCLFMVGISIYVFQNENKHILGCKQDILYILFFKNLKTTKKNLSNF